MRVLGPYLNNYGRLFVRVGENGKYKTVSYSRYLVEQELGRPLATDEDVHHKDGNFLNNELSNLEIIRHGVHQQMHNLKAPKQIEYRCSECGKLFILSKEQRSWFMRKRKNRFFCSKRCAGICSRREQLIRDDMLNVSKFGETLPMATPSQASKEEGVET